ncbi:MAG: hybrid sensor histidine kinase/response regulator, partial [Mariprofundaceae bacterium]|nr:hybrid sensor histidine kinase/response regulator [Mariprofundaceae bacterium]
RQLLGMAVQSSHALGEMLGELMDIARLDADKIVASRKIVPLAPLLNDCVEELRPSAIEKGLSLRYFPPRKGCVDTDPVLLKRILRNLLANAIRHTESGGVLVGARLRGERMLIEVYDTGPGIGEDEIQYIFDEFYQVDNPERDREKGLGLGLAIVRRVAVMLGHEVYVKSRPGRGSCFSIAVPLCEAVSLCEPQVLDMAVENDDFTGLFVVVVDDDRLILQGMRSLLLDWGCEVLLAEGEDALLAELITHDYPKPDILISDYRLRGERTGLDVAASVRAHFDDAALPVVIISGDVHPDVQKKVEASDCRWLEKPVAGAALKRLLASVAKKSV